jgi:hypothetical protein
MCKCVEYFLFIFLCTLCFEILLLLLEGGHASYFFLCSLIGAHIFFYASLSIYFSSFFFSVTPFSFCKKRNLFGTWSTYFWWMDGMFCVTPGVGVRMCMWVYVISIMEAWKDSTKGHNNLAKLNGSQASICRRFEHWYRHMALVGNMTIEELALFYFQKEIVRDFTILWDRADQHCHTISY